MPEKIPDMLDIWFANCSEIIPQIIGHDTKICCSTQKIIKSGIKSRKIVLIVICPIVLPKM